MPPSAYLPSAERVRDRQSRTAAIGGRGPALMVASTRSNSLRPLYSVACGRIAPARQQHSPPRHDTYDPTVRDRFPRPFFHCTPADMLSSSMFPSQHAKAEEVSARARADRTSRYWRNTTCLRSFVCFVVLISSGLSNKHSAKLVKLIVWITII